MFNLGEVKWLNFEKNKKNFVQNEKVKLYEATQEAFSKQMWNPCNIGELLIGILVGRILLWPQQWDNVDNTRVEFRQE